MTEELDKMWNNEVSEIIKKLNVLKGNTTIILAWSHRRNPTHDGNVVLPLFTSLY